MPHRITLTDVAKECGVSPATVSMVFRDKPGIPTETRLRILAAARALGYTARPVPQEPQPRGNGLSTLGVVMLKIKEDVSARANPFYSSILAGIEDTCRQRNINLLYTTVPVDADHLPIETPRLLLSKDRTQGLLLVGILVDEKQIRMLDSSATPVVLVDAYSPAAEYDALVSDNEGGAHQAVEYLIRHGHRHIGLVTTRSVNYPSIQGRKTGYLRALQDHGIAEIYCADSALVKQDIPGATRELLRAHPQITAVFACNDNTALSVLQAAEAMGWRIPHDLSLIGFDDIDLATLVRPALTTMHVDKVGMGRLAVETLIHRLEFPDTAPITVTLRLKLIERQSVMDVAGTRYSAGKASF
jgi:LacI family transcriptional regulator